MYVYKNDARIMDAWMDFRMWNGWERKGEMEEYE